MNRKTFQRALAALACLAIVLAAGGFAYYWFLLRGPLAGDTSHDFGEVIVTGPRTDVSHTFHLVNRTDQTITLDRVIPSCGCAQISPGTATVAPGESLDLTAVLSVSSSGTKTSPIRLMLNDGKVQFLHLSATGRRMDDTPAPDIDALSIPATSPMPLYTPLQPN